MKVKSLVLSGIIKSFENNQVLKGVDLSFHKGEITILMGANGAGKSTLVRVVTGVIPYEKGDISLDGQSLDIKSPKDAIKNGIYAVHQDIVSNIIPELSIAENLIIDQYVMNRKKIFVNKKNVIERAQKVLNSINLEFRDLGRKSETLSLAEKQLLAIARSIAFSPKILILDEPTSSLSLKESEKLFETIKILKERGITILYITHRTFDIKTLNSRIVTLRDGIITGEFENAQNFPSVLVSMLGSTITSASNATLSQGKKRFEINKVCLSRGNNKSISMSIYENEITAVIGLVGSGKGSFVEMLFGRSHLHSGRMILDGKEYNPISPKDAIQKGVFCVPKDRQKNSVIQEYSIAKNLNLPFLNKFSKFGFMDIKKEISAAVDNISKFNVVCEDHNLNINNLSGGNQQKVMLARWFLFPCSLLIIDEAFQGIDIGARADISRMIRSNSKSRATLMFFTDIDEALEVADRIFVIHDENIVGEHLVSSFDRGKAIKEMAG